MLKPTEYIQNFPSLIYSRLTPSGSKVNKQHLRLSGFSDKKDRIDGEVAQSVFYEGFNIRLGYDADKRDFWTIIEPTPGERELSQSGLGELLQHPETSSTVKPDKREEFQAIVTKGRIFRKAPSDPLSIRFKLLKEGADYGNVFEAFWYAFKPVIAAVYKTIEQG
jgi:hypothetical protein